MSNIIESRVNAFVLRLNVFQCEKVFQSDMPLAFLSELMHLNISNVMSIYMFM